MLSTFERTVAFRYLRAKRKESFISVISAFSLAGIALGVATLIVVMAVMNGFRIELTQKILGLSGHVSVYSFTSSIENYDALAERVRTVEGVKHVTPLVTGQAMAVSKYETSGVLVKGIKKEEVLARPMITENVVHGSLDDFGASDTLVLGVRLAERLDVDAGSTLTLMSPRTQATVVGAIPRLKTFRVAAIVETGFYDFDSATLFMPLEMAQIFFRYPHAANELEIMVNDPNKSGEIRTLLTPMVIPYEVQDWQMKNATFFGALQVERNVMFLILALIVVVAAFNIISGLVMLVKDKGKDIAILRTMGASEMMIMRIFFTCGASIGVAGTLIGFILGLSFSMNIEAIRQGLQHLTGVALFDPMIYFLSELPAHVIPSDVIKVVGMSLTVSFLATLYPAWKAARMKPAEALRYE